MLLIILGGRNFLLWFLFSKGLLIVLRDVSQVKLGRLYRTHPVLICVFNVSLSFGALELLGMHFI